MRKKLLLFLMLLVFFNAFSKNPETVNIDSNKVKTNYIGFTPTFIFMGMYGLVYSKALDEQHIITGIGGYTNFDWSPIPFLHNDDWIYQNLYFGINYMIFPFSNEMFPHGFYYGFDFVPSIGFWDNRNNNDNGIGLSVSADIVAGYSWIFWDKMKLSTDLFLNFNTPEIKLKGNSPGDELVILPFFDINVGFIF